MDKDREIIFSPPDITDHDISEVVKVLKSGWITTGPETKRFERELAEYCSTKEFAAFSSATAAMEMVYRLLGVGEGDEVITTAYTYTATASAIIHVGAKPVIVDVVRDGALSPYEIDYDAVLAAINERTKVITSVDVAGVMCDYNRLFEIVNSKRSLFTPADNEYQKAFMRPVILADSSHGLGAVRDGKKSGQAADFTCFSFHAVKNLTTAEGGALTWRSIEGIDDEKTYKRLQIASLHGQSKDALEKSRIGAWEYDIEFPGYKCNMTDIQAALGITQLLRYDKLLERRREIVKRYNDGIERINEELKGLFCEGKAIPIKVLDHISTDSVSSAHLYPIRIGEFSEEERNRLIEDLENMGVSVNVHYKPLPMFTAYKRLGYDIKDYPRAYDLYKNEITLPLHTRLSDGDVDYVLDHLKTALINSF